MEEGEIVIPIVLDLKLTVRLCNETIESDDLSVLFNMHRDTIPKGLQSEVPITRTGLSRKKRFIPLLALGVGVVTAVWSGVSYALTQNAVEAARADEKKDISYVSKLMLDAQNENSGNFIAIKKSVEDAVVHIQESMCENEKSTMKLLFRSQIVSEFDDLLEAMHTQRLTASIIPAEQLYPFVDNIPQLKNTIYDTQPYMLYYYARAQFNFIEAKGDVLRGAIILPIIKIVEPVSMQIMSKNVDGALKLFGPIYITRDSNRDVSKCRRDVNLYLCREFELDEPEWHLITSKFIFENGVVIVNTEVEATIKTPNGVPSKIVGPAVYTKKDVDSVIIEGYTMYTGASSKYIHGDTISLNDSRFNFSIKIDDNVIDSLKKFNKKAEEDAWYANHQLHLGWNLALSIVIIIIVLVLVYFCCRGQKGPVANAIRLEMSELRSNLVQPTAPPAYQEAQRHKP